MNLSSASAAPFILLKNCKCGGGVGFGQAGGVCFCFASLFHRYPPARSTEDQGSSLGHDEPCGCEIRSPLGHFQLNVSAIVKMTYIWQLCPQRKTCHHEGRGDTLAKAARTKRKEITASSSDHLARSRENRPDSESWAARPRTAGPCRSDGTVGGCYDSGHVQRPWDERRPTSSAPRA